MCRHETVVETVGETPRRRARLAPAAGLVAPLAFVAALVQAAATRADYQHAREAISLLGVPGAPRAAAMNVVGFGVCGLLVCLFACAFLRSARSSVPALVAGCSWLLSGLATVGLGVWPHPHDNHLECAGYASLFAIAGVAAGTAALSSIGRGAWLGPVAVVAIVATVVYLGFLPQLQGVFGLVQRVHVAGVALWLVLASLRLLAHEGVLPPLAGGRAERALRR
jgi:hypothetical membrane protein